MVMLADQRVFIVDLRMRVLIMYVYIYTYGDNNW